MGKVEWKRRWRERGSRNKEAKGKKKVKAGSSINWGGLLVDVGPGPIPCVPRQVQRPA